MKMLFVSNISNGIGSFCMSSLFAAKGLGYEYHRSANFSGATNEKLKSDEMEYGVKLKQIDFIRSPFDIRNLKALKQLILLVRKEKYDLIHCNTPIGGILGRICGRLTGVKKIIYTAHGFHFYKGAPLFNRTVIKCIEQLMACWTDVIITMNREDYEAAKKFKLRKNGKIYFVHGVGIDTKQYFELEVDRQQYRKELELADDDFVCISAGDLIPRKNFETAIRTIAELKNPKIHLLICGEGPEKERLMQLAEQTGVGKQIHFLGFRTDIKQLLKIVDCYLFTTLQEGMPRALMEAMAAGLPVVASKIRGNADLIEDGEGGFLCEPADIAGFAKAINNVIENDEIRSSMKTANIEKIKEYDISVVKKELEEIYSSV